MNYPSVAIIILNWNGIKDTIDCLRSLQKVDYDNFHIIVVDNNSKKNELSQLKNKFASIIPIQNDANLGFAEGNNVGIRKAMQSSADYVLLLNNDTIVSRDFLKKLVNFAELDEKIGIVGPKILYHNSNKIWFAGGKIQYWSGFGRHLQKGKLNSQHHALKPLPVDFITGCCFLVKREVIEKVGMLDSNYFAYTEDADWCFRARSRGYKIIFFPDAVIWHKKSASAGNIGSNEISSFQAYYFARNALIFGKKNLQGLKKTFYFIGQFTFRFIYFFVFQCQNNKARFQYLKGLKEGIVFQGQYDKKRS